MTSVRPSRATSRSVLRKGTSADKGSPLGPAAIFASCRRRRAAPAAEASAAAPYPPATSSGSTIATRGQRRSHGDEPSRVHHRAWCPLLSSTTGNCKSRVRAQPPSTPQPLPPARRCARDRVCMMLRVRATTHRTPPARPGPPARGPTLALLACTDGDRRIGDRRPRVHRSRRTAGVAGQRVSVGQHAAGGQVLASARRHRCAEACFA